MITIRHKGNFNRLEKFLKGVVTSDYIHILEKYGREGVAALSATTPKDSGLTAESWDYEIHTYPGGATIHWINTNVVDGVSIAVILQYGHGTRNGGFVQGRDYINPAMQPIFDKIADDVWKEVIR